MKLASAKYKELSQQQDETSGNCYGKVQMFVHDRKSPIKIETQLTTVE